MPVDAVIDVNTWNPVSNLGILKANINCHLNPWEYTQIEKRIKILKLISDFINIMYNFSTISILLPE